MKCASRKIDHLKCTSSDCKESTYNVGDLGLIPGLGRSAGGGPGNPLQYFCLEKRHGQRSLAGSSLWGLKESDMTEQPSTHTSVPTVQWSTPIVVQKSPPSNSRTFSFCKIGPDLLDVANTNSSTLATSCEELTHWKRH